MLSFLSFILAVECEEYPYLCSSLTLALEFQVINGSKNDGLLLPPPHNYTDLTPAYLTDYCLSEWLEISLRFLTSSPFVACVLHQHIDSTGGSLAKK